MPATISAGFETHLQGEVTTLCTCCTVTRRDGTVFYFTDHDADLMIDGHTYVAALGYDRSALAADAALAVSNFTFAGIFDASTITVADVRAGLWDYAEIQPFIAVWSDISLGKNLLPKGWLGEVTAHPSGTFTAETRGLGQRLQTKIGEVYSALCRADLGDTRCTVPIAPTEIARSTLYAAGDILRVPVAAFSDSRKWGDRIYECTAAGTTAGTQPTYTTTAGNSTTDGGATFLCRQAWTRAAVVATAIDAATFNITVTEARAVDAWFNGGLLTWESGANAGRAMEIKGWVQSTGWVELYLPMDALIAAGDRCRVVPGCNKDTVACKDKYDNIINMRAEPFVPGTDAMLGRPDANL